MISPHQLSGQLIEELLRRQVMRQVKASHFAEERASVADPGEDSNGADGVGTAGAGGASLWAGEQAQAEPQVTRSTLKTCRAPKPRRHHIAVPRPVTW